VGSGWVGVGVGGSAAQSHQLAGHKFEKLRSWCVRSCVSIVKYPETPINIQDTPIIAASTKTITDGREYFASTIWTGNAREDREGGSTREATGEATGVRAQ
jgi:hypothetical protein